MALLSYRDLLLQSPGLVTGDTITTVSESTSDTAKKIPLSSLAPHVSLAKYSLFRANSTGQIILTGSGWTTVTLPEIAYDLGSEFSTNYFKPNTTGKYYFTATLNTQDLNSVDPYSIKVRLYRSDGASLSTMQSMVEGGSITNTVFSLNTTATVSNTRNVKLQVLNESAYDVYLGISSAPTQVATVNFCGYRVA